MNKAEIVARIARESGLTKVDAGRALDAFLDNVTRTLKKGDKVTLVGFGTFIVSRRRARTGRHPQSGIPIKIPKRRVARFLPGKDLRETVG